MLVPQEQKPVAYTCHGPQRKSQDIPRKETHIQIWNEWIKKCEVCSHHCYSIPTEAYIHVNLKWRIYPTWLTSLQRCKGPILAFNAKWNTALDYLLWKLSPPCSDYNKNQMLQRRHQRINTLSSRLYYISMINLPTKALGLGHREIFRTCWKCQ